MRKITTLAIHHPAYSKAHIDAHPGQELIDLTRRSHVQGNGWNDIGYHYLIHFDKSGKFKIFDGRPDSIPGAHVYGHNSYTLGICVVYPIGYTPPQEQLEVLAKLIAGLSKKYGFPINRQTVKGHREFPGHYSNACPGDGLFNKLNDVVRMAQNELNPPKNFPQQEAKQPEKKENQISNIEVKLPNGESIDGLLLSGATHVHITVLEKIAELAGVDLKFEYVPGNEKQKHYVQLLLNGAEDK